MRVADWRTVLELARPLLADEEGVVPFPYDDNRAGRLRRIDRSEVTLSGGYYLVNATGGTATIGYGDTDPAVIDRYGIDPIRRTT